MPHDYPIATTCSRSEVSLGGLDETTDLSEIFVEHNHVLTDLKIKVCFRCSNESVD
jgi:hypothetical protein